MLHKRGEDILASLSVISWIKRFLSRPFSQFSKSNSFAFAFRRLDDFCCDKVLNYGCWFNLAKIFITCRMRQGNSAKIKLMFNGGLVSPCHVLPLQHKLNTIKWTHLMHSNSRNFYWRMFSASQPLSMDDASSGTIWNYYKCTASIKTFMFNIACMINFFLLLVVLGVLR